MELKNAAESLRVWERLAERGRNLKLDRWLKKSFLQQISKSEEDYLSRKIATFWTSFDDRQKEDDLPTFAGKFMSGTSLSNIFSRKVKKTQIEQV